MMSKMIIYSLLTVAVAGGQDTHGSLRILERAERRLDVNTTLSSGINKIQQVLDELLTTAGFPDWAKSLLTVGTVTSFIEDKLKAAELPTDAESIKAALLEYVNQKLGCDPQVTTLNMASAGKCIAAMGWANAADLANALDGKLWARVGFYLGAFQSVGDIVITLLMLFSKINLRFIQKIFFGISAPVIIFTNGFALYYVPKPKYFFVAAVTAAAMAVQFITTFFISWVPIIGPVVKAIIAIVVNAVYLANATIVCGFTLYYYNFVKKAVEETVEE